MSSKSSGFVSYLSGKEPIKGHLEGAAQAHKLFEATICLSLSGGTITFVPTCLARFWCNINLFLAWSLVFYLFFFFYQGFFITNSWKSWYQESKKSALFSVSNSVSLEEFGVQPLFIRVQWGWLRWHRYPFSMYIDTVDDHGVHYSLRTASLREGDLEEPITIYICKW